MLHVMIFNYNIIAELERISYAAARKRSERLRDKLIRFVKVVDKTVFCAEAA